MPARLVLSDLDNTLIDRAGAFRIWARAFSSEHELGPSEIDRLERLDGDGLTARLEFFSRVRSRYALKEHVERLVAAYRRDYPRCVQPPPAETWAALRDLRRRGWRIGIVGNGTQSQEAKIAAAGLTEAVDGWAISEIVGSRKPEPGIFRAAAEACDSTLEGGWMIGDSAKADIGGAVACGLSSVWISRGRGWVDAYRPDAVADSAAEAVAQLLERSNSGGSSAPPC